jgi:tRNA1(Val) A37 N6-methylase TrmN6
MADVVATNPPFFQGEGRPSPDPGRRTAHTMAGGGLGDWLRAAADLLRPRGRLAMIHRADNLQLCLDAMGGHFGSVEIRPVYPKPDRPASRILVRAIKGGHAPLVLAPPLVLHGPDGAFTLEAARLHAAP